MTTPACSRKVRLTVAVHSPASFGPVVFTLLHLCSSNPFLLFLLVVVQLLTYPQITILKLDPQMKVSGCVTLRKWLGNWGCVFAELIPLWKGFQRADLSLPSVTTWGGDTIFTSEKWGLPSQWLQVLEPQLRTSNLSNCKNKILLFQITQFMENYSSYSSGQDFILVLHTLNSSGSSVGSTSDFFTFPNWPSFAIYTLGKNMLFDSENSRIFLPYENKIQKVPCLLPHHIFCFLFVWSGEGWHLPTWTPFLSSSPFPDLILALLSLPPSPVHTCTQARAFINLVHLKFCFGICLSKNLNQHSRECSFDRLLQLLVRRI